MFISCDQVDPHRSPKNAYFNSVIGIYFLSFYDHPILIMKSVENLLYAFAYDDNKWRYTEVEKLFRTLDIPASGS